MTEVYPPAAPAPVDHDTQLALVTHQVKALERDLRDARDQQRQVVLAALEAGAWSEAAIARATGLSRTTIRAWRTEARYVR